MRTILTITSKGQTTLPVAMRRKLGIPKNGGTLDVSFNDQKGQIILTKPLGIDELSSKITGYMKPHTKPVLDVDAYYQEYRDKN